MHIVALNHLQNMFPEISIDQLTRLKIRSILRDAAIIVRIAVSTTMRTRRIISLFVRLEGACGSVEGKHGSKKLERTRTSLA